MIELNQDEMKQVQGGGVNWSLVAGIGAVISFIIGVIDGYVNPIKCNSSK